ncbi:hypothetical protein [Haliangium sp.]|uniref:hypothetical protein n=1 Tax=Haliangium sp. TaxID=2663208 RepID=UPI003D0C8D1B
MRSALFSLVLVLALPHANGYAQSDPDMRASMTDYFDGERRGSIGFMTMGTASLVAGGLLVGGSSDLRKGMAYPMLGLGAAQFLVGAVVFLRTPGQVDRLGEQLEVAPADYRAEELVRIEGVNRTFRYLVITELVIVAGGATTAVVGYRSDNDTATGIGAGLVLEALVILTQDLLAARRANRYTRDLQGFGVSAWAGRGELGLVYRGSF